MISGFTFSQKMKKKVIFKILILNYKIFLVVKTNILDFLYLNKVAEMLLKISMDRYYKRVWNAITDKSKI